MNVERTKQDPASDVPSAGAVGVLTPPGPDPKLSRLARVLAGLLYTVRYRSVRGVAEVLITASSPAVAERTARAWVNAQPGRLFLGCAPAVAADESILDTVNPEPQTVATGELSRS